MTPDITKPAWRAKLMAHYEVLSDGEAHIICGCLDEIGVLEAKLKRRIEQLSSLECVFDDLLEVAADVQEVRKNWGKEVSDAT